MRDTTTPDIGSLIKDETIHSSLYTDRDIFELECEKIFEGNWVYVAHESELPRNGDYLRRTMGTTPILVTKSAKGIHVVVNRCTHRGNLLCPAPRGRQKAFGCKYHGWVFGPDGELVDIPFPDGSENLDKSKLGLRAARVESYRGFIFASLNHDVDDLITYLGNARQALDRASDLSPVGEIQLSKTWVQHSFKANWKMISENEADGYHVNFVHDSFGKAITPEGKYDNVLKEDEEGIGSVSRYLGNGHTEIDYEVSYGAPMKWLGVKEDRYPEYTAAMKERYGEQEANTIMRKGPPHTFIFPNLFLAETCFVVIQPISVNESINWHTPLYLKGVPDKLNQRILRQGEPAMGPSAFLTADDAVIAERQWGALDGDPGWLDLSRGADREVQKDNGVLQSHYTDETSNRGFWNHYKSVFQ